MLANIKQKWMCIMSLSIMPLLLSGCITWINFSFHVSDVSGDIKSQHNILSAGILNHCLCLWKLIYISPSIRCGYQWLNFLKTLSSISWTAKMYVSSTQILLWSLQMRPQLNTCRRDYVQMSSKIQTKKSIKENKVLGIQEIVFVSLQWQSATKVRLICHLENHKS